MFVGRWEAKFGSKHRFGFPAMRLCHRLHVRGSVAVEKVNSLSRRGEGRVQERAVGPFTLDAPRGVHDHQVDVAEGKVVKANLSRDDIRFVGKVSLE